MLRTDNLGSDLSHKNKTKQNKTNKKAKYALTQERIGSEFSGVQPLIWLKIV